MRRQIVIMLLGLMTTLSLPAFAIAGSRENDHAPQPYKYIGKELDRTHGARHHAPWPELSPWFIGWANVLYIIYEANDF